MDNITIWTIIGSVGSALAALATTAAIAVSLYQNKRTQKKAQPFLAIEEFYCHGTKPEPECISINPSKSNFDIQIKIFSEKQSKIYNEFVQLLNKANYKVDISFSISTFDLLVEYYFSDRLSSKMPGFPIDQIINILKFIEFKSCFLDILKTYNAYRNCSNRRIAIVNLGGAVAHQVKITEIVSKWGGGYYNIKDIYPNEKMTGEIIVFDDSIRILKNENEYFPSWSKCHLKLFLVNKEKYRKKYEKLFGIEYYDSDGKICSLFCCKKVE